MMRGLDQRQEVDPGLLLRDTRTMGQRMRDFFSNPSNTAIVLATCAAAAYFIPALADLILLVAGIAFTYSYTRRVTLPFRMPKRSGILDYNDIIPGGGNKPHKARGITFFGNDRKTNEELWFNNEDMRTHILIFGSTGSGKTETLVSLSYNAFVQGSGLIYVDGKGDNTLFAKIFSMARSTGREDDVLLINFMTGARDIVGPQERRLSNTLNPFSSGSSSMLSQLVVGLMSSSSENADGDMWKGRAISFVEALMKILVYMRDQGQILLDANSVRNYFHLDRLEAMVADKVFVRDGAEAVSLEGVPEVVLEPITNYVLNLPGYNKEKKGKQVSQVFEQHGFITMQLGRVFTSLADTYGHIIRTNLPEVDFKDVVLNRRILVVLLPALEKSPDELANLGKVILSSLKAMMAAGLGENVEGEYHDLITRKPTNAPTPFLCILDEYGYYSVQGFAVVAAQARSLGFSAVFCGQDLPAFQKSSKEEAASIGANTNIKICMKLEDPIETWEFFTKTAGEAYVTKVDAFQTKETSVTNNYLDTKSASFEKRARIDLLDLKDQTEGEAHIFFKSRIVRYRTFYANPPPVKRLQLNQFLKVEAPSSNVLYALDQNINRFQEVIKSGVYFTSPPDEDQEINLVAETLVKEAADPIEAGVSALIAYHNRTMPEELEEDVLEETEEGELDIFAEMRATDEFKRGLISDDLEHFTSALLLSGPIRSDTLTIEHMMGKSEQHAANISSEIVKDMQQSTHYPPEVRDEITAPELTSLVGELIGHIKTARDKASIAEE